MRVTQFNIILLSFLTFISIGFIQCGDSAEDGDSETAVLTITGNLMAPQAATESSSVSALISTATVDAAVAEDETDALDNLLTATGEAECSVELYTMEGLLVSSTTGIAGEYVCPISDLNDIRPTDVTDPTASFRPQLVASIDCGVKHYETFIGGSVDPAGDLTAALQ